MLNKKHTCVCCSLLNPSNLWQCSSLFTPPTSVCYSLFIFESLTVAALYSVIHCLIAALSVSSLVVLSFSVSLFYLSWLLLLLVYSSSSKLCSLRSSHYEVRLWSIIDMHMCIIITHEQTIWVLLFFAHTLKKNSLPYCHLYH